MKNGVLNYTSPTIKIFKKSDVFSENDNITKTRTSSETRYHSSHPRQVQLSQAIVINLIIELGLPLSLVERESFINFMSLVEPKFTIISRRTLTLKSRSSFS